jgi:hypothetical protein
VENNVSPALNEEHILKVIPNYQTVENPAPSTPPLSKRDKWNLFFRESSDPYTIVTAGLGAALSQKGNGFPKYGVGMAAYGQRLGAALADVTSQSFFSDAVLAGVFHEDPRYFRKGPSSPILTRIAYSVSRPFVTRSDSGHQRINLSCLLGTSMGIALSNAYYPSASVSGSVVGSRFGTSLLGSALGNLLPEFWPDVRERLFRKR